MDIWLTGEAAYRAYLELPYTPSEYFISLFSMKDYEEMLYVIAKRENVDKSKIEKSTSSRILINGNQYNFTFATSLASVNVFNVLDIKYSQEKDIFIDPINRQEVSRQELALENKLKKTNRSLIYSDWIKAIRLCIEYNLENLVKDELNFLESSPRLTFNPNDPEIKREIEKLFKLDTVKVIKELSRYPGLMTKTFFNVNLTPSFN